MQRFYENQANNLNINYMAIPGLTSVIPEISIERKKNELRPDTIQWIKERLNYTINYVAWIKSISTKDIRGQSRKANVVEARAAVAYVLKNKFNMTYNVIGKAINRNHSSALYLIQTMQGRAKVDKNYRAYLVKLMKLIENFS